MIRVVATFAIKPGSVPSALEIAKKLISATREEAGCLDYTMVQSTKDKNCLVVLESWESQQHLDVHSASPHFAAYVPQLAALCTVPPVVEAYTVVI